MYIIPKNKITVKGVEIIIFQKNESDYISLTDMLKAKDGDFFVSDWLRNRNTVEFLGIWEKLHNPNFNYGEFTTINIVYANEADVLNVALFGKSAKEWRDENSGKEGNVRDYADVTQLVVLANLEGMNAEFIRQGLPQLERIVKLNQIAIVQMRSLLDNKSVKKLS